MMFWMLLVQLKQRMGVGCGVFFKQETAYEMRISDWSSDVCSSDLKSSATLFLRSPATGSHRTTRTSVGVFDRKPEFPGIGGKGLRIIISVFGDEGELLDLHR